MNSSRRARRFLKQTFTFINLEISDCLVTGWCMPVCVCMFPSTQLTHFPYHQHQLANRSVFGDIEGIKPDLSSEHASAKRISINNISKLGQFNVSAENCFTVNVVCDATFCAIHCYIRCDLSVATEILAKILIRKSRVDSEHHREYFNCSKAESIFSVNPLAK